MGVKTYRTSPNKPRITFYCEKAGGRVMVDRILTTDNEDLQETIELSESYRLKWIFEIEVSEHAQKQTAQKSPQTPLPNPQLIKDDEDVLPDELIKPEPGKNSWGLHELRKLTVPELRGICQKQKIKYSGLKKKELIQALIRE